VLSDMNSVSTVGVAARYAAQLRALLALNRAHLSANLLVKAASRESQTGIQASRTPLVDLRA